MAKILNEGLVFISEEAILEEGVIIYPFVVIEGETHIQSGSRILPFTFISNSKIGKNVVIESSNIKDSKIKDNTTVGPFAHIRNNTIIGENNRIGNFVEVKKSITGKNTKAAHLSYLGDAEIGNEVNVGAGTITCNYDGVKKNPTFIEDGAFIGSDSQLVAPVKIGKGAYVGAGSTITKDVPPYSLAITRSPQRNIKDWALKKKKKNKDD